MINPSELYQFMPFALRLTKNEADAQDLLHDAYVKLHSCEYMDMGKLTGMVKTVIVNRFIDLWRKKKKFGVFVSVDAISCSYRKDEFENEDLSHRQKAIIARYLYNLNPRDKKIWELYMDGFTQKQIAQLMNWNSNAVSAVCHRIKHKLLKTIQG